MSKDIINWSGVSEHLTGHPTYVRKGKVLKEHKEAVADLLKYIEFWKTKYPKK